MSNFRLPSKALRLERLTSVKQNYSCKSCNSDLSKFQSVLKPRRDNDLFEKDPFKTHSFNVRYAEIPCFPVYTLKDQQRFKDIPQTTFFNNNFCKSSTLRSSNQYLKFYRICDLMIYQGILNHI